MWGRLPVLNAKSAQLLRTDLPAPKEQDPDRPVQNWRPADENEGLGLGKWLVVAAVVVALIVFAWIAL